MSSSLSWCGSPDALPGSAALTRPTVHIFIMRVPLCPQSPPTIKIRVAEPPDFWAAPAPDQNFGGKIGIDSLSCRDCVEQKAATDHTRMRLVPKIK